MIERHALIQHIKDRALRFGDFTLASGRKASYYLDGKQLTLDAQGSWRVAEALLEVLAADAPDAIGGLTLGADPIVGAVLALAGQRGITLKGFLVRKEPKQHGTQRWVEGPLAEGSRVVIVEDVVTTGGSALAAIERVQALGCRVVRVVCIVDRLEGGRQALAARGYELTALATIEDLGLPAPKV